MPRKAPEERREQLLNIARTLFKDRGYEQVGVADILAEAGLSKGGFYHHFQSKDNVLRELIRQDLASLVLRFEQAVEASNHTAALINVLRQESTFQDGEPDMLTTLNSFQARTLYLDVLETTFAEQVHPLLREFIAKGSESGAFRNVDPDATAELFLAVNNHGNRGVILGDWDDAKSHAYHRSVLDLMGVYLGITDAIQQLIDSTNLTTEDSK